MKNSLLSKLILCVCLCVCLFVSLFILSLNMNQIQIDQLSKHTWRQKCFLPFDDYVFHMVLKKGPTISNIGHPVFTEVYDLAQDLSDQKRHIFKMSVLDASSLVEQWPSFETSGIAGSFKFQSTSGLLKSMKIFDEQDPEKLWTFLLDPSSHTFVRTRYEALYQLKQNDGSNSVEESTSVVERMS